MYRNAVLAARRKSTFDCKIRTHVGKCNLLYTCGWRFNGTIIPENGECCSRKLPLRIDKHYLHVYLLHKLVYSWLLRKSTSTQSFLGAEFAELQRFKFKEFLSRSCGRAQKRQRVSRSCSEFNFQTQTVTCENRKSALQTAIYLAGLR